MTDILRFNFCTVHIYDTYLIVEIDEEVSIKSPHIDLLINVVDTYYRNKPFVYISKRTYFYSVEPIVFVGAHEIENLLGFAVIGKKTDDEREKNLVLGFTDKPFKYFDTVEDAIKWAEELLAK